MYQNAKRKRTGENYPIVDEKHDEICTLQPLEYADPKGIHWVKIWEPRSRFEVTKIQKVQIKPERKNKKLALAPQVASLVTTVRSQYTRTMVCTFFFFNHRFIEKPITVIL